MLSLCSLCSSTHAHLMLMKSNDNLIVFSSEACNFHALSAGHLLWFVTICLSAARFYQLDGIFFFIWETISCAGSQRGNIKQNVQKTMTDSYTPWRCVTFPINLPEQVQLACCPMMRACQLTSGARKQQQSTNSGCQQGQSVVRYILRLRTMAQNSISSNHWKEYNINIMKSMKRTSTS